MSFLRSRPLAPWFPICLVLYEIIVYLSNDMYLPALPRVAHHFGVSLQEAQKALIFWLLGSSCFQWIFGPISDAWGRRSVFFLGVFIFIFGSGLALIPNYLLFSWGRFFQGTAVCFISVAGYASIHERYESQEAARWLTWMGSITILAPALGPLLGAWITTYTHWIVIFHFFLWGGLITGLAVHCSMEETLMQPKVFSFSEIFSDYRSLLRNRNFMTYSFLYALTVMGFFAWMTASPVIFIHTLQKSEIFYGSIQCAVFAAFFLGGQLGSSLLKRKMPMRSLIQYGLWGGFLPVLGLLGTSFLKLPLVLSVALMMLAAFFSAMSFGSLNRLAIDASEVPMGRRVALFSTVVSLFGSLAAFLVSFFAVQSFEGLSCLLSSAMSLALVLYFSISRGSKIGR